MSEEKLAAPAIVCHHVHAEGAPILHVVHDGDDEWQVLCGGEHGDAEAEQAQLLCLSDALALDPSLEELRELCFGHHAERSAPGEPWEVFDDTSDEIAATVAEHGWHVCLIPEGAGEDEPAFAYTIGLWKTLGHPEIIVFGMPEEWAGEALNNCGDAIRDDGARFEPGQEYTEILECPVRFLEVAHVHYPIYFGYGTEFYEGGEFPALQLVLPDETGRFPWDEGCDPKQSGPQPLLGG